MRNVILYGSLAKKYGKKFKLEVNTAAEAIRALGANFPEFLNDIRSGQWHVVRGDHLDRGVDLDIEEYAGLALGNKDIHVAPVIAGSKRSGLLKILLGVTMIATAFVGAGFAMAGMTQQIMGGALGGLTYGNMAIMGTIMTLGGISQMLSPEKKDKDDETKSYIMNGPGNTSSQGVPVPLVYGECLTGGVLISGGVDVLQVAAHGGGGKLGGGKK